MDITKKKKIAFVISSLAKGGAERMVARLANHMADQLSLDITVIIFFSNSECYTLSPAVQLYNFDMKPPPYYLLEKPFVLLKRTMCLRHLFQSEKFDQIFSFMDPVNLSVILTGFPVVISTHVSLKYVKTYSSFFFLYKRKNVKKVIALTNTMKNDFKKFNIYNTRIIPNSFGEFNKTKFDAIPSAILENFKKQYFLAVGRYNSQKNFSLLIEAFSKAKCSKDYVLLIAGDGPERLLLTKLIEQSELQENIKLIGTQDDIELEWLYRNARATVMSSNFEGFGNVLIESLSKGTPVISTDCSDGPSDIVINGRNGFLVPVGDILAMRDALDLLAGDEQLRQNLADYACESVAYLTIDKIANQWLNLK
ncbi:MAG: glycosyltransferase [Gammaproteobacteria bacterium]|nr:glycosyltransferase [Gammaproteobacteria bacterium]